MEIPNRTNQIAVAQVEHGVYHTGCVARAYRAASYVDYPASFALRAGFFFCLDAVHLLLRDNPMIPITTVNMAQSANSNAISLAV